MTLAAVVLVWQFRRNLWEAKAHKIIVRLSIRLSIQLSLSLSVIFSFSLTGAGVGAPNPGATGQLKYKSKFPKVNILMTYEWQWIKLCASDGARRWGEGASANVIWTELERRSAALHSQGRAKIMRIINKMKYSRLRLSYKIS